CSSIRTVRRIIPAIRRNVFRRSGIGDEELRGFGELVTDICQSCGFQWIRPTGIEHYDIQPVVTICSHLFEDVIETKANNGSSLGSVIAWCGIDGDEIIGAPYLHAVAREIEEPHRPFRMQAGCEIFDSTAHAGMIEICKGHHIETVVLQSGGNQILVVYRVRE